VGADGRVGKVGWSESAEERSLFPDHAYLHPRHLHHREKTVKVGFGMRVGVRVGDRVRVRVGVSVSFYG